MTDPTADGAAQAAAKQADYRARHEKHNVDGSAPMTDEELTAAEASLKFSPPAAPTDPTTALEGAAGGADSGQSEAPPVVANEAPPAPALAPVVRTGPYKRDFAAMGSGGQYELKQQKVQP